jgi:hypothetical protein
MINNPNIRYLATGDSNQLKQFGYEQNNVIDTENYINNAINLSYNHNIKLQIITFKNIKS